jgi:hypothetical protein
MMVEITLRTGHERLRTRNEVLRPSVGVGLCFALAASFSLWALIALAIGTLF